MNEKTEIKKEFPKLFIFFNYRMKRGGKACGKNSQMES